MKKGKKTVRVMFPQVQSKTDSHVEEVVVSKRKSHVEKEVFISKKVFDAFCDEVNFLTNTCFTLKNKLCLMILYENRFVKSLKKFVD